MKKGKDRSRNILLIILAVVVSLSIFIFLISFLSSGKIGNVALIPIDGVLTIDGSSSLLGESATSSTQIIKSLEKAEKSLQIQAIVLEINSPGGSAVASDEISAAIKKSSKPVVALIREVGASGGYWVASSANYVIANRMSITGSIGVISSYLEFSGLMDDYGVKYEQLTAGKYKDMGTPYRELTAEEKKIMQSKLDQIHEYFIQEIAQNRNLPEDKVKELATGEFFLGVEALDYGLIDELGDIDSVTDYLKNQGLKEIEYIRYEHKATLLEILGGVFSDYSFRIGEGLGSIMLRNDKSGLMV